MSGRGGRKERTGRKRWFLMCLTSSGSKEWMGDERGDRRWMSRVEFVYTCEVQLHIASSCIAHCNYVSLLFSSTANDLPPRSPPNFSCYIDPRPHKLWYIHLFSKYGFSSTDPSARTSLAVFTRLGDTYSISEVSNTSLSGMKCTYLPTLW